MKLIALTMLLFFFIPTVSLGLVNVSYPSQVLYGHTFIVSFSVYLKIINSTDFPVISSGTEIINGTYRGGPPYSYYILFHLMNISRVLEITFVGEYNVSYSFGSPGIVLYGGDFKAPLPDGGQSNFTSVLLTFNGRLWYHINSTWYNPLTSLPFYGKIINNWINVTSPVNYTVIFQDDNGKTLVKEMFINGKEIFIGYLTPIPWNFSYVGIRLDTQFDFIKPIEFYAIGSYFSFPFSVPYIVYINGKEYASGFTNSMGQGSLSIKATSPLTINITFPTLHEYKVIYVGVYSSNVKIVYPIKQVSILVASAVLIVLGYILERRRRRNT